MDLSKYPLDKLFGTIATVIPGFTAFVIYEITVPGTFKLYFDLTSIGYNTRLSVALVACLVVGYTIVTILGAFVGLVIGGAWTKVFLNRLRKPSYLQVIAPWRDPDWRAAAKRKLGPRAPNDTQLITDSLLNIRKIPFMFLPKEQQELKYAEMEQEKLRTQADDMEWRNWFDHYQGIVLNPARDSVWYVQTGLNFTLEATALYVLISSIFVPALRVWWLLGTAALWFLILLGEQYLAWKRVTDGWFTLPEQVAYLSKDE